MSIRVTCGKCGVVLKVKEDQAGSKGKCPACRGTLYVPTLEEVAAAQAAKVAATETSAASGASASDTGALKVPSSKPKSKSAAAEPSAEKSAEKPAEPLEAPAPKPAPPVQPVAEKSEKDSAPAASEPPSAAPASVDQAVEPKASVVEPPQEEPAPAVAEENPARTPEPTAPEVVAEKPPAEKPSKDKSEEEKASDPPPVAAAPEPKKESTEPKSKAPAGPRERLVHPDSEEAQSTPVASKPAPAPLPLKLPPVPDEEPAAAKSAAESPTDVPVAPPKQEKPAAVEEPAAEAKPSKDKGAKKGAKAARAAEEEPPAEKPEPVKPEPEPAPAAPAAAAKPKGDDFDLDSFLMEGPKPKALPPLSDGTEKKPAGARGLGIGGRKAGADDETNVSGPSDTLSPPNRGRGSSADAATAALTGAGSASSAKDLLARASQEGRARASAMPEEEKERFDYVGAFRDIFREYGYHVVGTLALCLVLYFSMDYMMSDSPDLPPLASVSGTLTIKKQPAEGVVVYFTPVGNRENAEGNTKSKSKAGPLRSASAVTDKDGRFELMYMEGIAGAVVGQNRVWVEPQKPEDFKRIPGNYQKAETSGDIREVKATGGEFNIDL